MTVTTNWPSYPRVRGWDNIAEMNGIHYDKEEYRKWALFWRTNTHRMRLPVFQNFCKAVFPFHYINTYDITKPTGGIRKHYELFVGLKKQSIMDYKRIWTGKQFRGVVTVLLGSAERGFLGLPFENLSEKFITSLSLEFEIHISIGGRSNIVDEKTFPYQATFWDVKAD